MIISQAVQLNQPNQPLKFDYFLGTGTNGTTECSILVITPFECFAIEETEDNEIIVYEFISDLELRQYVAGTRELETVHLYATSFHLYENRNISEVVGALLLGKAI